MFKELFESMSSLMTLPILGMLICFTVFIGVLVRISQRARTPEYDRMAALPLADDNENGGNDDD